MTPLFDPAGQGAAEHGIRQALEYAFHTGVPFIVLTDGRTWSFYRPAEQGSYQDLRVYKLDLFERPPTEAAETLGRYGAMAPASRFVPNAGGDDKTKSPGKANPARLIERVCQYLRN
jgi:hypothetical protein